MWDQFVWARVCFFFFFYAATRYEMSIARGRFYGRWYAATVIFQREYFWRVLQHCVTFVTLLLSVVVHALVLRARRKRSFSYFAVSEGRSEHGAISMIHGHDSLYYHGIGAGSHKRRGHLRERKKPTQRKAGGDCDASNDFKSSSFSQE